MGQNEECGKTKDTIMGNSENTEDIFLPFHWLYRIKRIYRPRAYKTHSYLHSYLQSSKLK